MYFKSGEPLTHIYELICRMSQPEDIHMLFNELDYLVEGTEDAKKLAISSWAAFSLWSEPEKMITTKKKINHK